MDLEVPSDGRGGMIKVVGHSKWKRGNGKGGPLSSTLSFLTPGDSNWAGFFTDAIFSAKRMDISGVVESGVVTTRGYDSVTGIQDTAEWASFFYMIKTPTYSGLVGLFTGVLSDQNGVTLQQRSKLMRFSASGRRKLSLSLTHTNTKVLILAIHHRS